MTDTFFVYVLYSFKSDRFYIGHTSDLSARLLRHQAGLETYTSQFDDLKLLWSCRKASRLEAVQLERKLKNLSRERLMEFILKYNEGLAGPDDCAAPQSRDADP